MTLNNIILELDLDIETLVMLNNEAGRAGFATGRDYLYSILYKAVDSRIKELKAERFITDAEIDQYAAKAV